MNSKASWNVRFDTFLTHIRHDIKKGVDNESYSWQNIVIEVRNGLSVFQSGIAKGVYPLDALGTEKEHSQDNRISYNLGLTRLQSNAKMSQENLGNLANNTSLETETMKESTKNEIASLATTVGAQFKEAGVVALKTKTGEALLKAVENLVLEKAGFSGRVKFKFFPEALDIMVAAGVSIIVAEYAGENHAAQIAAEALRLAAMRRITDMLPITEILDKVTSSGDILEKLG